MKQFMRRLIDEFFLYSSHFVLFFIIMLFLTPAGAPFSPLAIFVLTFFLIFQIVLLVIWGRKPLLRFIFSFITPAGYMVLQAFSRYQYGPDMAVFFIWGFSFYVGFFQAASLAVKSKAIKSAYETLLALGTVLTLVFFYFYLDLQIQLSRLYIAGRISWQGYNQALGVESFLPAFASFIQSPQHLFFAFGAATFGIVMLANKVKLIIIQNRIQALFGSVVQKPLPDESKDKFAMGENIECAIVYADVWNFSGLVEKTRPVDTLELLNSWYRSWAPVVTKHGGYIDKMSGDTIVAVFGLGKDKNVAEKAIQCALEYIENFRAFQEDLSERSLPMIGDIGIGVHKGEVFAGNLGIPGKTEYSVIGEGVSTAARLDALCREFKQELVISHPLYREMTMESQSLFAPIGEVYIKGSIQPIPVYGRLKA